MTNATEQHAYPAGISFARAPQPQDAWYLKEHLEMQVITVREASHCETQYEVAASTRAAAQIVCRNSNKV